MLRIFCVGSFLILSIFSYAQDSIKQRWVDSLFSKLNIEERIGQLIFPRFPANDAQTIRALIEKIKANKISGFRLSGTCSPENFAHLCNELQGSAKIPLLIQSNVNTIQHFDSIVQFYDREAFNAIKDDSLKKNIHKQIIRQANQLQIQLADSLEWLTYPIDVNTIDKQIKAIKKSLRKNRALAATIDSSVKKILRLKYSRGLFQNKFINTDNLIRKLNLPEARLLKQHLAEALVTVVRNDSSFLPIQKLNEVTFASVCIGKPAENEFTKYLSKYARFEHHSLTDSKYFSILNSKIEKADVLVVGIFGHADSLVIEQLKTWKQHHNVIICLFSGSEQLKSFLQFPSLLHAYSGKEGIPQVAAQVIFGGLIKTENPHSISDSLTDTLVLKNTPKRFSYQLPEAAEMDSRTLDKIDTIANEAIRTGATPGCHVLVAKDGKVVYEKSFGSLTYQNKIPVTDETIYDLASVTKVSATLQAVMYMVENGLIDVNKKASVYLPELKGTNKEDFIIKDILTHQAGLWPYLPFWIETVKDSSVWKKYYSATESEEFPFPVSENLFASKTMKDSLWHWIVNSKIREKPARTVYDYRYSDMGFYISQHLAEKIIGIPLEVFLQKNIYGPLGAYTTGYLPLRRFPANRVAPTEKDTLFRKSLLIGYVHDQGAAMHGGIAGHAGLFSDANDLAKLGQMWLNKGSYGGIQFFKPETIHFFTAKQYETSRRGLGWDKPLVNLDNGPTSIYSSPKTFGHTGFTGTCIWVDPEFNLVYVFLSNRVNPNMYNNKLLKENIRPRIQDVVYQSIFEYCKKKSLR
ncbi:MAG: serine hydrolase [Bacteroidetes bacterium]|nr:serine hydrolase [Bacteroidota bacterium]